MAPETASLHREEDLKRLAGLRLIDDDFMTKCFEEDPACVELVLRIVLEMPGLVVEEVRTQVFVANLLERSVRMDVVATDSAGRVMNIEIQRSDKGAGRRRARFNSSMMDASLLEKGADFDHLPETYVIFITERDVLGRGLPLYKIERSLLGTDELFDDGAHILYVNGAYRGDTPVGRLMHDFFCTRAEDMYYDVLAQKVSYFKDRKEGSDIMCRAMEEMREQAVRGSQKAAARDMLADGILSLEKIAQYSRLSLDEVKQLAKELPQ